MSANLDLAQSLVDASSEEDVTRILESHPLLKEPANWHPYVPPEEMGLVLAQQPHPVSALTERIVNSIDAVLTRECLLRGIDPKGPDAPRTMAVAVEDFFEIPQGDFAEVSAKRRRELAEQIVLLADGPRKAPNLLVVDHGEGQHASEFRNTFLSLLTGNKLRIPFVQGQFSMGGTGVFRYCRYQLIISRRPPKLLNGKSDVWGLTLVRRRYPGPQEPSSRLEYFAKPDGEIFTAEPTPLKLPGGASAQSGDLPPENCTT